MTPSAIRGKHGFTLVEVMIGTTLMAVVLVAAYYAFQTVSQGLQTLRVLSRVNNRFNAVETEFRQQARFAFDTMPSNVVINKTSLTPPDNDIQLEALISAITAQNSRTVQLTATFLSRGNLDTRTHQFTLNRPNQQGVAGTLEVTLLQNGTTDPIGGIYVSAPGQGFPSTLAVSDPLTGIARLNGVLVSPGGVSVTVDGTLSGTSFPGGGFVQSFASPPTTSLSVSSMTIVMLKPGSLAGVVQVVDASGNVIGPVIGHQVYLSAFVGDASWFESWVRNKRTAVTGSSGEFLFPTLVPGKYFVRYVGMAGVAPQDQPYVLPTSGHDFSPGMTGTSDTDAIQNEPFPIGAYTVTTATENANVVIQTAGRGSVRGRVMSVDWNDVASVWQVGASLSDPYELVRAEWNPLIVDANPVDAQGQQEEPNLFWPFNSVPAPFLNRLGTAVLDAQSDGTNVFLLKGFPALAQYRTVTGFSTFRYPLYLQEAWVSVAPRRATPVGSTVVPILVHSPSFPANAPLESATFLGNPFPFTSPDSYAMEEAGGLVATTSTTVEAALVRVPVDTVVNRDFHLLSTNALGSVSGDIYLGDPATLPRVSYPTVGQVQIQPADGRRHLIYFDAANGYVTTTFTVPTVAPVVNGPNRFNFGSRIIPSLYSGAYNSAGGKNFRMIFFTNTPATINPTFDGHAQAWEKIRVGSNFYYQQAAAPGLSGVSAKFMCLEGCTGLAAPGTSVTFDSGGYFSITPAVFSADATVASAPVYFKVGPKEAVVQDIYIPSASPGITLPVIPMTLDRSDLQGQGWDFFTTSSTVLNVQNFAPYTASPLRYRPTNVSAADPGGFKLTRRIDTTVQVTVQTVIGSATSALENALVVVTDPYGTVLASGNTNSLGQLTAAVSVYSSPLPELVVSASKPGYLSASAARSAAQGDNVLHTFVLVP